MKLNLKAELDNVVPEHITLTEYDKEHILMAAKRKQKDSKQKGFLKPLFVSVAMLFLIGFFVTPYIQQAFFSSLKTEKVMIGGVELDPLINSIYIDATNEIVYTDHNRIYSYNMDTRETVTLAEEKGSAPIREIAVSDKWLVWDNASSLELNILNRLTNERSTVEATIALTPLLTEDTLVYLPFRANDINKAYYKIDLNTLIETPVHTLGGEGANSKPAARDGKLVVPEYTRTEEGDKVTTYFVYNLQSNERIGQYSVPYEDARNVILTDNRIYAELTNDGGRKTVLGYVDLRDGQFYQIDVPSFWDYGIYGNYVALSLPNDESNSVKLFEMNGVEVNPLSTFNGVPERLVRPRFTEEGTLVVNGEGVDFPMYLVKTK